MKSFKQFVSESFSLVPVVDIETSGTDVSIPEIKNELNRNLALILRQSFKTVEEAITKVNKILSMYSLDIPFIDFDNIKQNSVELPVGHHNLRWDEFDGKLESSIPYILKFSFVLNDGLYKCSAELR